MQDRIVMGAQRKSHYIEPKAKLMTAYHEVRGQFYVGVRGH